jgi:hypothetical protein
LADARQIVARAALWLAILDRHFNVDRERQPSRQAPTLIAFIP